MCIYIPIYIYVYIYTHIYPTMPTPDSYSPLVGIC